MSLEAGTRIADLVPTNPVGATDFVSQGDDHIRLIKACLQGSFPSLGATAVAATAEQINNLASLVALSIIGRAANSTGAPAAITAAANDRILRRVADALDFGQLTAGMFPNTVVPDAALSANVALKGSANNFTAQQQFQHAGGILTNYVGNYSAALVQEATGGFGMQWKISGTEFLALSASGVFSVKGALAVPAPASAAVSIDITGPNNNWGLRLTGGATTSQSYGALIVAGTNAADYALYMQSKDGLRVLMTVDGAGSTQLGTPTGGGLGASTINAAGKIAVNGEELGLKDVTLRLFSGDNNTALADRGRSAAYTGAGGHTFTCDDDVPENGVMLLINGGTAPLTIAASGTLYWFGGAGSIPTGSRTLDIGGVATLRKTSGTGNWHVWGNGLS